MPASQASIERVCLSISTFNDDVPLEYGNYFFPHSSAVFDCAMDNEFTDALWFIDQMNFDIISDTSGKDAERLRIAQIKANLKNLRVVIKETLINCCREECQPTAPKTTSNRSVIHELYLLRHKFDRAIRESKDQQRNDDCAFYKYQKERILDLIRRQRLPTPSRRETQQEARKMVNDFNRILDEHVKKCEEIAKQNLTIKRLENKAKS